jgi:hypothetical protein
MDNDVEMMMHQIMQDDEDVAVDEEEKLLIMAAFLCLRARINAPPRQGGFRPRKKNKEMQRMIGVVMLDANYFADSAIHTPIEFWRHFRMNKELFMKIVIRVREYNDYFLCKKSTRLSRFTSV